LNEINLLCQEGSQREFPPRLVQYIPNVLFHLNAVLNFLVSKESWKSITVSTKILNSTICFQQSISILVWFVKDHVTLKTWLLEIQLCYHGNKLKCKIFSKNINQTSYLKL